MIVLRILFGVVAGLIAGAALGFGAALVAMSFDGSHQTDGTFGMLEVFTMVPSGAGIGMIVGIWWGFRRQLQHGRPK